MVKVSELNQIYVEKQIFQNFKKTIFLGTRQLFLLEYSFMTTKNSIHDLLNKWLTIYHVFLWNIRGLASAYNELLYHLININLSVFFLGQIFLSVIEVSK